VLLGNGDGTFQKAVTYSLGANGATSVAVADVNWDGKPDLIVSTGSNTAGLVGVLLGNGDGTFQPEVTYNSGGLCSFSQTNNCPSSLIPKVSCTIDVKFHPKTKGVLHGSVNVTDNAAGRPQKVPLTGTGTYVNLAPTKVNFGAQPVGIRTPPQTITLRNKGNGPVRISAINITGADSGDFAETNDCGKQVASGASCFIKVTFKPLKKGKRTADVSISDDGGGSPQKVELSGTGT
jgi:hypothetical protein